MIALAGVVRFTGSWKIQFDHGKIVTFWAEETEEEFH